MHGQRARPDSFQRKLHGRLEEWETRKDAKAGGWGPCAMVEALAAYGVEGYEVRAYENRNQALRESAIAMTRTGAPAILIAWRGAHTWVMTGFKADGDPTVFGNARITGIRVFDPWYRPVSSIWGPLRSRAARSRTCRESSATSSSGNVPKAAIPNVTASTSWYPDDRPPRPVG